MGFKVNYDENKDGLEVFLNGIQLESEKVEREMLRKSGDKVRELIVAELNKHKRVLAVRYKGRPALADDVSRTIRTSKWGDRYVRVGGGRRTGTLWHLVNDGTLHSSATHFMDRALAKLDGDIDKMWDKTMR